MRTPGVQVSPKEERSVHAAHELLNVIIKGQLPAILRYRKVSDAHSIMGQRGMPRKGHQVRGDFVIRRPGQINVITTANWPFTIIKRSVNADF